MTQQDYQQRQRGTPLPQESSLLPHDDNAEGYVLGCLLMDAKAYSLVGRALTEDCFYNSMNREIYRAIDILGKDGKEIDFMLVGEQLARMKSSVDAGQLMSIMAPVSSTAHLEVHALRLVELGRRRKLWQVGQQLSLAVTSEMADVDVAQQKAIDGMAQAFGSDGGGKTLAEVLGDLQAEVEENQKRQGRILGTMTGFRKIDEKGGLHKGDLVIVAGESSQGKTSFALSIVRNAVFKGYKVAFYSLEMTNTQMSARFVSPVAGVSSSRILYGSDLAEWEKGALKTAMAKMPGDRLFFDDDSLSSLDDILVSIRMMKARYGIHGAVIDYLQILGNNARNSRMTREQMLGDAARRLKNLAKELGIWIMALSQLSRNKETKEPTLDRIRDSGQIVEAADVVMLIYRPEAVQGHPQFEQDPGMDIHGKALVKVAKGRNIGIFDFFCDFNAPFTCFSDLGEASTSLNPYGYEQALPF